MNDTNNPNNPNNPHSIPTTVSDAGNSVYKHVIGKYVVVRSDQSGCHAGILVDVSGNVVAIAEARRIWQWNERYTLSEISLKGVGAGSRISAQVPHMVVFGWCELVPCTREAEANLRAATWG